MYTMIQPTSTQQQNVPGTNYYNIRMKGLPIQYIGNELNEGILTLYRYWDNWMKVQTLRLFRQLNVGSLTLKLFGQLNEGSQTLKLFGQLNEGSRH